MTDVPRSVAILVVDTRPRHTYRTPDGTLVPVIFDHDEAPPPSISFRLLDGTVVAARFVLRCAT